MDKFRQETMICLIFSWFRSYCAVGKASLSKTILGFFFRLTFQNYCLAPAFKKCKYYLQKNSDDFNFGHKASEMLALKTFTVQST